MALQLQRKISRSKLLLTLTAVIALALQPGYGAVSSRVASAAPASVHSTDLGNWYLGDTRSNGRNEMIIGGLRVYTLSNDNNSKAAGYYGYATNDVNFDLDNANDFNLSWSGTAPAPGGQLVVDLDNDGDLDGILVVENAYGGIGGNLWLPSVWGQGTGSAIDPNTFPNVGGGGGPRNGSLATWNASFPDAKVKAIGYSLGSGIKGDGVISRIVAGGSTYTFGLPIVAPTATITSPAQNGVARTNSAASTLRVTGTFKDDKAVNYLQLELVKDGNLATVYTMHYNNPGLNANGNFSIDMPVPANLVSGQYELHYTATDFDGGVSARMLRSFTIDNTAPLTTLVAPIGMAGNTFTVSGAATDNIALNRVYVQLVNRQNNQRYGGTTIHLNGTQQDWSRSYDATALNLPNGTYAAHVAVTDNVGNTTSVGWSNDFTLDKIAPVITVKPDFKGDKDAKVFSNVSFKLSDNDKVDKFTIGSQTFERTNAPYSDANFQNIKGALVQGENTITLYDVAGNSASYTFVYDSVVPGTPQHISPTDGAFINVNDFLFDWGDVEGATRYELQNSQSAAVNAAGSFQNVQWTGDYQRVQPTVSEARSVGADGTWYWQVRSIDQAGNVSGWSTPWGVTIDMQAPAAPVLTVKESNGTNLESGDTTGSYGITASWNQPSDDTVKYLYKYWNDIEGNQYKEDAPYIVELSSTSQYGVFNQGEGTHYLQIVAVDRANNQTGSNVFEIRYELGEEVVVTPVEPVDEDDTEIDTDTDDGTSTGTTNTGSNNANGSTVNGQSSTVAATPQNTFIAAVNQGVTPTDTEAAAEGDDGDVLGTSATEDNERGEVAGATDEAGWSIGDMAWYWWVLSVLGLMGLWLLVAAGIRRFRGSEA